MKPPKDKNWTINNASGNHPEGNPVDHDASNNGEFDASELGDLDENSQRMIDELREVVEERQKNRTKRVEEIKVELEAELDEPIHPVREESDYDAPENNEIKNDQNFSDYLSRYDISAASAKKHFNSAFRKAHKKLANPSARIFYQDDVGEEDPLKKIERMLHNVYPTISKDEFVARERILKHNLAIAQQERFWDALNHASHEYFAPNYHTKSMLRELTRNYVVEQIDKSDYFANAVFQDKNNPNKKIIVHDDYTEFSGDASAFGFAEARAMIALEMTKLLPGQAFVLELSEHVSPEHNAMLFLAMKEYEKTFDVKIKMSLPDNVRIKTLEAQEKAFNRFASKFPIATNDSLREMFKTSDKEALLRNVFDSDKKLQKAAQWMTENDKVDGFEAALSLKSEVAERIKAKLESMGMIAKNGQQEYELLIDDDKNPDFERIASIHGNDSDKLKTSFQVAAALHGVDAVDITRSETPFTVTEAKTLWQQVAHVSDIDINVTASNNHSSNGAAKGNGNGNGKPPTPPVTDKDSMMALTNKGTRPRGANGHAPA